MHVWYVSNDYEITKWMKLYKNIRLIVIWSVKFAYKYKHKENLLEATYILMFAGQGLQTIQKWVIIIILKRFILQNGFTQNICFELKPNSMHTLLYD